MIGRKVTSGLERAAGGGRRVRPDMLQGSAVMTSGELAIVIAGTREDWSGGARTLTPRESSREPNGTLWFGVSSIRTGDQSLVSSTRTPSAGCRRRRTGDRGRRLVDAVHQPEHPPGLTPGRSAASTSSSTAPPLEERHPRHLPSPSSTTTTRGNGRPRDLAAVLATCHRPRRRGSGSEPEAVALVERGPPRRRDRRAPPHGRGMRRCECGS